MKDWIRWSLDVVSWDCTTKNKPIRLPLANRERKINVLLVVKRLREKRSPDARSIQKRICNTPQPCENRDVAWACKNGWKEKTENSVQAGVWEEGTMMSRAAAAAESGSEEWASFVIAKPQTALAAAKFAPLFRFFSSSCSTAASGF